MTPLSLKLVSTSVAAATSSGKNVLFVKALDNKWEVE